MLKTLPTRRPVDKTAQIVTSPGVEIEEPSYPLPHYINPPPSDNAGWMAGKQFGKFTVIGYLRTHPTNRSKILLVRCQCGRYEERAKRNLKRAKSRAKIRKNGEGPKCQRCAWLAGLKRQAKKPSLP